MSAAVLRAAAALMRSRAEAAVASCAPTVPDWHVADRLMRDGKTRGDAEHIASWHPAVALAVADWLDREADTHDLLRKLGARGLRTDGQVPNAFTVAHAYLGSDP